MSKEILLVVESASNEKGLPEEVIFEALEVALATAAKKHYEEGAELRVAIDRTTGDHTTFRYWDLVPDDEEMEFPAAQMTISEAKEKDPALEVGGRYEIQVDSVELGRITAQIAKQVIQQKVREAERAQVVETYRYRVGELVSGQVKKVTRESLIADLGHNAEALLPRDDWLPRETFRVGDRLRALLKEVEPEARGPQLILTRTSPEMLEALFKVEVPEIADGIIEILACARDPGSRAKIAVKTNDGRIDPVGACVGMRGSRVQTVSNELSNERIDIIPWDDNIAQLAINSLSPAEVVSILVDEETNSMDIAVSEENLAQAVGRGGQNVKLATELTGWKLNIMSEEEATQKHEEEASVIIQEFMQQLDVDEDVAVVLVEEGFTSLEEVVYVPIDELNAIEGFDEGMVKELRDRAQNALSVQEAAAEKARSKATPAEDLLNLEGMDEALAHQLAGMGISTMEDLAEQSIEDLRDMDGMTEERAGALIMAARAPWFEEAEAAEG